FSLCSSLVPRHSRSGRAALAGGGRRSTLELRLRAPGLVAQERDPDPLAFEVDAEDLEIAGRPGRDRFLPPSRGAGGGEGRDVGQGLDPGLELDEGPELLEADNAALAHLADRVRPGGLRPGV